MNREARRAPRRHRRTRTGDTRARAGDRTPLPQQPSVGRHTAAGISQRGHRASAGERRGHARRYAVASRYGGRAGAFLYPPARRCIQRGAPKRRAHARRLFAREGGERCARLDGVPPVRPIHGRAQPHAVRTGVGAHPRHVDGLPWRHRLDRDHRRRNNPLSVVRGCGGVHRTPAGHAERPRRGGVGPHGATAARAGVRARPELARERLALAITRHRVLTSAQYC